MHGQFIPASVVLSETGEQAFVMVEDDVVTPDEMLEILYEGHRQHAHLLRCVAVYMDWRLGSPQPSDVLQEKSGKLIGNDILGEPTHPDHHWNTGHFSRGRELGRARNS
jgi:hypothetical protein